MQIFILKQKQSCFKADVAPFGIELFLSEKVCQKGAINFKSKNSVPCCIAYLSNNNNNNNNM